MYTAQGGSNLDLLLVGDNPELLSTVNGVVKKSKVSTTSYNSQGSITLIFDTGRVNNNQYIQTDISTILTSISPYSFEFDVNLKIKAGDHVFAGYNSSSISSFNLAGMNTISSSSYYWSILRTFSNEYRTYQNNGPFYFESLLEYASDTNLSDVHTEISKLSNDILILQNDPGEIERILRLEDKT
jgi:hypothetical protein